VGGSEAKPFPRVSGEFSVSAAFMARATTRPRKLKFDQTSICVMLTVSDLAAIISAVAVLVGVMVGVFQLRNFLQLRQMDLVMKLYSSTWESSFQKDYVRVHSWKFRNYADFQKNAQPEDWEAYNAIVLFFENMGLLLKRNLAKIDLLDDLVSGPILQTWERVEPIIGGYRKKYTPTEAEWFEYLYKAIKDRIETLQEPG